ncbi:MAG: YgjP-like metallopeptidase domain-containing protein [Metamycoplasmataceae bacterium]
MNDKIILPLIKEIFVNNKKWILEFRKSIFENEEVKIKNYVNKPEHIFIFVPQNIENKLSENLIRGYEFDARKFINKLSSNEEIKPFHKIKEFIFLNKNSNQILFFGKLLNLKFIESVFNGCVLGDDSIKVFYKKNKNQMQVLKEYLIKELDNFIKPIFNKYLLSMNKYKLEEIPYQIVFAKTYWGINMKRGLKYLIKYNVSLILLEPKSIEAVIVHELAHLEHRNHFKAFKLYGESLMENFIKIDANINNKIYVLNFKD